MKENWQNRNIREFLKKNTEIIIASILAPIIIFLYYYFTGWSWKWENIEVMKFTLLTYGFISALTFKGPWRVLHDLYLYRVLYWLSPSYDDFTKATWFLWLFLNLITATLFIFIVNLTATVIFNIYTFTVYLIPSILITITIVWLYYWYVFMKNKK